MTDTHTKSPTKDHLTNMTKDVISLVSSFMGIKDCLSLSMVSKHYDNIIGNNSNFWIQRLKRDYGVKYLDIIKYGKGDPKQYYKYLVQLDKISSEVIFNNILLNNRNYIVKPTDNLWTKLNNKLANLSVMKEIGHIVNCNKEFIYYLWKEKHYNIKYIAYSVAKEGNVELIKMLISDNNGDILEDIFFGACHGGNTYIIMMMIERGVHNFQNGFIEAIKYDKIEVVQLMIYYGVTNFSGGINLASEYGHLEIVRLMIHWIYRRKIDIHTKLIYIKSALTQAASRGHLNIIRYLIEDVGADNYKTVLLRASFSGHIDIVEYIVTKPISEFVDAINEAMGLAAEQGHIEIIKLLTQKGANDWGNAIGRAIWSGHYDLAATLQKYKNF
jgi:ankyrin repeat protein